MAGRFSSNETIVPHSRDSHLCGATPRILLNPALLPSGSTSLKLNLPAELAAAAYLMKDSGIGFGQRASSAIAV